MVLNEPNFEIRNKVEKNLAINGIEFRRGLSGGGNQLRQPYLRKKSGTPDPTMLPNVDHVHNFGWYLGNYPNIDTNVYEAIKNALKSI